MMPVKQIKTKLRPTQGIVLIPNRKADYTIISKAFNTAIDKINELVDRVNELEDALQKLDEAAEG